MPAQACGSALSHGDEAPGRDGRIVRRALLPAPIDDAEPCERQGPYGGLLCLALGTAGRCAGPGVHMVPHRLSALAGGRVRCVRLSPGASSPWCIADPQATGILNNRKKTLTVPLRACWAVYQTAPRESPPTLSPGYGYWSPTKTARLCDLLCICGFPYAPTAMSTRAIQTARLDEGCCQGMFRWI